MSTRDDAFDRMSRSLAGATSRRGALRLLGGGILAGAAGMLLPRRARAVDPFACGHSTCDTGAALSPTCGTCAALVCATDLYCCNYAWDAQCVAEANTLCAGGCDATDPAPCAPSSSSCAHDKCTTGRPLSPITCDDPCVREICAWDDYCCNQALGHWDEICVGYVASRCSCDCSAPAAANTAPAR